MWDQIKSQCADRSFCTVYFVTLNTTDHLGGEEKAAVFINVLNRTQLSFGVCGHPCFHTGTDEKDIPPPPISSVSSICFPRPLQNHNDQTETHWCTPSKLKRASQLYWFHWSKKHSPLLLEKVLKLYERLQLQKFNQVPFNWLEGGRELENRRGWWGEKVLI